MTIRLLPSPRPSRALFVLSFIILGCAEQEPASRMESRFAEDVRVIECHAGVIEAPLLEYDFSAAGVGPKEIAAVTVGCGCTRLSLRQGEVFDFSNTFRVNIQLDEFQPGKGQQNFLVRFTDGSAIEGLLSYDFRPPPFATPREMRFFEDIDEKELLLCFPGEKDVTIQGIVTPTGFSWEQDSTNQKPHEISLVFELDRSLFTDKRMGVIEIVTTSQRKPRFALPYSVLSYEHDRQAE